MKTNIIGIFKEEDVLVSALKKIKAQNIDIAEVFTPYPIHEVFKIMKRKTKFQLATFFFAALGCVGTYLFVHWASVDSYPLTYGGKPHNSWPSFVIITFVTTIATAILLSVITFFVKSKMYPGKKPKIIDKRITDNAFVVLIETNKEQNQNEIENINSVLKNAGASEVIQD